MITETTDAATIKRVAVALVVALAVSRAHGLAITKTRKEETDTLSRALTHAPTRAHELVAVAATVGLVLGLIKDTKVKTQEKIKLDGKEKNRVKSAKETKHVTERVQHPVARPKILKI